jgi:ribosome-binding factor A
VAKATFKRATRVADQIRIEIADILMRKTKDPRVGFVTVTDVEVTNDLRLARVYVTTGPIDRQDSDIFAGLAKAVGFIRAELGRRLHLRYTPELIFRKDTSGPRGNRIMTLLDELAMQDQKAGEAEQKERPESGSAAAEGSEDPER